MAKSKYGMVIDLQKCVGCGACALACKTENNTQNRSRGQTFNWADFTFKTEGKFPNTRFTAMPVLCNHCTNAACVDVCPVKPVKAMYKDDNGITMHNDQRCIGCRKCQKACPYSEKDVKNAESGYSVISYNRKKGKTHGFYRDEVALISGCTSSGAEVARKAGSTPPHATEYTHADYESVRTRRVTEKCVFCAHRLAENKLPYCVDSCPAGARVFGDLSDADSNISKLLKKHQAMRLKEEAGTEPNVYYIRNFKAS